MALKDLIIKGRVEIYHVKGWTITKDYDFMTQKIIIKIEKDFYSEYPIYYGKGKVGYDNPEKIPVAVKLRVKKLYMKTH